MNERIRELVKHATVTHYHGMGEIDELNTEKFAELIVEECFKVAMIESKGHMNPIDLMKRMKEHFGVEE